VWGGLARLASFGLVARTGDLLDALARCDFVCLDKTGTLSTDTLAVRAWVTEPPFHGREAWLKTAVAAVEEGLAHPIAAALRGECNVLRYIPAVVTERRIEPGLGVVALVADESGRPVEIRVGERELVEGAAGSPAMKDGRRESAPAREAAGKEIFVFVDGAPAATIELAETWREGLDEALRELQALGVGTEILTGDASAAAGRFEGAAMRAGLTPADKHERVRELVAAGRCVAFVGDGVNDAAAMSAAQASIAMQAGAELARAAAMAVFAGDDLRFLPRAIRVARAARRSVSTNLLFAAAYNTAGMALAAAGMLHPVVAALLMVGSSAFVSVRALRSSGARKTRP
jgi:cation transport ATPase